MTRRAAPQRLHAFSPCARRGICRCAKMALTASANPTLCASAYEPPTMTFSWSVEGVTLEKAVEAVAHDFQHRSLEFEACGLRWKLMCALKKPWKDKPSIWVGLRLLEPNCVFKPAFFAVGIAGMELNGSALSCAEIKTTFTTCQVRRRSERTDTGELLDRTLGWGVVSHEELQAPGGVEKYMPDGKMTFEVKLRARTHSEVPAPAAPPPDRLTQLGALLDSGEGADVTFSFASGNCTLHAHALILMLGSSTLKPMLHGPLAMPAPFNIRVPDDIAPGVMQLLLRFLYTEELPTTMPCQITLRLLHAADYYNVPRLATLCDFHLRNVFAIENVLQTLVFAHEHSLTGLRAAALRFVAEHSAQLMHAPQWGAMLLSHPELIMSALATVAHGEPPPVIVALGRSGGAAGSVTNGGGQRAVEDGEPPGPKRPRVGDAS